MAAGIEELVAKIQITGVLRANPKLRNNIAITSAMIAAGTASIRT